MKEKNIVWIVPKNKLYVSTQHVNKTEMTNPERSGFYHGKSNVFDGSFSDARMASLVDTQDNFLAKKYTEHGVAMLAN